MAFNEKLQLENVKTLFLRFFSASTQSLLLQQKTESVLGEKKGGGQKGLEGMVTEYERDKKQGEPSSCYISIENDVLLTHIF